MSLKVTAVGTLSDIANGTDISKVHGGYFGDSKNVMAFCSIGIDPCLSELPQSGRYADFGGGQGFLADVVRWYIQTMIGKHVQTMVLDSNERFLADAKKRKVETLLCNIESVVLQDLGLATMRAVLHYNEQQTQRQILKNVFGSLRPGGRFVHQVSSSPSHENAVLRAAVVNLPSLGREGAGSYHWCTEEEAVGLHREAGFLDAKVVGYAPPCQWSPEEMWDRFNGKKENSPEKDSRKRTYLQQARELIEAVRDRKSAGIEELPDGRFNIHYTYPIVVGQK